MMLSEHHLYKEKLSWGWGCGWWLDTEEGGVENQTPASQGASLEVQLLAFNSIQATLEHSVAFQVHFSLSQSLSLSLTHLPSSDSTKPKEHSWEEFSNIHGAPGKLPHGLPIWRNIT